MAKFAHGTTIAMTTAFTEITYVGDIDYQRPKADRITVPNQSNTTGHKEHIFGLKDGGVVSFTLGYDPAVTAHVALRAAHNTRETFKISPPGATAETFAADVVIGQEKYPESGIMQIPVQLLIEGAVS